MDKRYSKEEVVELIHEYESSKCRYSGDANVWLKVRGFIDEPTHNTPTVDKDRIERYDKPNTPSYDKVMEAIERAEERIRTNSKHILTLQQEVNTLLDDKIDGSWFSKGVVRLDDKERAKLKKEFEDMYTVSTWWSRLMNRNN